MRGAPVPSARTRGGSQGGQGRGRPATRQDTDGTIRLGGEVRAAREHTNNRRLACADTSNRVGTVQSSGSRGCDLMRPYPSVSKTEHFDGWIQTVAGTETTTCEQDCCVYIVLDTARFVTVALIWLSDTLFIC